MKKAKVEFVKPVIGQHVIVQQIDGNNKPVESMKEFVATNIKRNGKDVELKRFLSWGRIDNQYSQAVVYRAGNWHTKSALDMPCWYSANVIWK